MLMPALKHTYTAFYWTKLSMVQSVGLLQGDFKAVFLILHGLMSKGGLISAEKPACFKGHFSGGIRETAPCS